MRSGALFLAAAVRWQSKFSLRCKINSSAHQKNCQEITGENSLAVGIEDVSQANLTNEWVGTCNLTRYRKQIVTPELGGFATTHQGFGELDSPYVKNAG